MSVQKRVFLETTVVAGKQEASGPSTKAVNWVFSGQTLSVGRSKEKAQMAIENDSTMSKRHFQVGFDGSVCRVVDLDSSNGTCVNGQMIDGPVEVRDGDEISAGKTVFRVGFLGDSSEPPSPPTVLSDALPGSSPPTVISDPIPPAESPTPVKSDAASDDDTLVSARSPRVVTLRMDETAGPTDRVMAWIHSGQQIVVGSSGFEADWRLTEFNLDNAHFRVSYDGETCQLKNLAGGPGTLVNGVSVSEVDVNDSDKINAGSATFFVEIN